MEDLTFMRLKKLILHGFKSFADRTEFVFDSPITGVGGLTKITSGNVDLTASNSFAGGMLITGGGVRFRNDFAAGTGINFIYSSTKYDYYVPPFKDEYGVAGLSIFGRLYPVRFLLVQAQPELNYTWGKRKFSDGNIEDQKLDPKFVPSLLVGAGAAIPLGGNGRSAMTVMYQYDVIQDPRSPYGSNAFLSIGFNF